MGVTLLQPTTFDATRFRRNFKINCLNRVSTEVGDIPRAKFKLRITYIALDAV